MDIRIEQLIKLSKIKAPKLVLVLVLFMSTLKSSAQVQSEEIDSLIQVVEENMFTDTAKVNSVAQQVFKMADEANNWNAKVRVKLVLLDMYHSQGEFKKRVKTLQELDSLFLKEEEYFSKIDNLEESKFAHDLHWGAYFEISGQFTKAEKYFGEMLVEYSEIDPWMLRIVYAYLGKLNQSAGKYDAAEEYYQGYIRSAQQEGKKTAINSGRTFLATVSEARKDYEKANEYLSPALEFYMSIKDQKRYRNNLISVSQRLSKNYVNLGQISNAKQLLKDSEILYEKNDPLKANYHSILGDAFAAEREWELSQKEYEKSIQIFKEFYGGIKHPKIPTAYLNVAKKELNRKDFEAAEVNNTKALFLTAGLSEKDEVNYPELINIDDEELVLKILNQRLSILEKLQEQGNQDYLSELNDVANVSLELLNKIKPEFDSKIDKLFLLDEVYPLFYTSMDIIFEIREDQKDDNERKRLLSKALTISESSKSTILLDAIRSAKAESFSGVPQDLLDEQGQLNAIEASLEKDISKIKNDEDKSQLQDSLFKIRRKTETLVKRISDEYPKFYNLKYNTAVADLSTVQKQLAKGELLLHYFLTEKWIYCISIAKTSAELNRVPLTDALLSTLVQYPSIISANDLQAPDAYKATSQELYSQLIPDMMDESISSVLIVPDGLLYSVPFETLLKSSGSDFLGLDKNVYYSPSYTFFAEAKQQKRKRVKGFLGFAPSFSNAQKLGELNNNTEEIASIGKLFKKARLFKNEAATTQSFLDNANRYKLLHLATHAVLDNDNADYSYLAFASNSDPSQGLLNVKDIYNTELNADLVTLSACETAKGQIQRGEGVMSMARAFTYAGASSVVTSLWKVDDESTATIMKSFYKHLKSGKSKSDALKLAKQDYLADTENEFLKQPTYWAGFVVYGDDSPIVNKSPVSWFVLLGVPLGLFFLFLLRRRKKMK